MVSYDSYFAEADSDDACNPSVFLSDFMDFKKLGSGGCSTVYEAKNKLDEQKYAIKCIKFSCSEEEQKITLREVKALAQLDHPHIVRYYHAWVEDCTLDLDDINNSHRDDSSSSIEFRSSSSGRGVKRRSDNAMDESSSKRKRSSASLFEPERTLYIKMELCQGQSLLDWLGKTKKRGRDTVNKMALQILSAVAYIHSKNFMHRDLKPANILLTQDNTIKVGDFNLVKTVVHDNENLEDWDLHSPHVGTSIYRSPELVSTQTYTEKVDVYAIGVIWVELLIYFSTGYERAEVLGRLEKGMFPIHFPLQFPMELELLQKMLAQDENDRIDAEGAFEELYSIMHSQGVDVAGEMMMDVKRI